MADEEKTDKVVVKPESPKDEVPEPQIQNDQSSEGLHPEATYQGKNSQSEAPDDGTSMEGQEDTTPEGDRSLSEAPDGGASMEGQVDIAAQGDHSLREAQDDGTSMEGQEDTLAEGEQAAADPFFYLKRDEFSSEIFKIELGNLPKKFGFGQLKKKLISLNLKPNKIKALPFKTFAFITFRSEQDREDAMTALNGHIWRGSALTVKKANPTADPLQKKRKDNQESNESCSNKKARMEDEDNIPWDVRLKNSVTPLWDQDYEEQLKVKTGIIEDVLKKLSRQLDSQCPPLRPWLKQQRSEHGGRCCELLPILKSPVLTGYRNKCEFTLGKSLDGVEKTLGFRYGKYSRGTSSVGEPYDCAIISDRMKGIVKVFQEFFRSSQYAAFDPETHSGNWRQLTVRESRGGDIMAFPEFHPQNLSQEEIDAEMAFLKDYFTTGAEKDSSITALFFSMSAERITGTPVLPLCHVFGEKFITEDLLEMKFRISPDAFFQVNTLAAEVLYNKVADWCNLSPTTTLLDVCCGTGTIGLTMAKRVKKVVGVEMCQPAIEDAKQNATLNGIQNAEYICGKAEDVMQGVTRRLDGGEEVVAVVDPPRAGLHPKVIKTLRRCCWLKKVIYVSCSPQSAMQNFLDLCRPMSRKVRGAPYKLIRAVPVDLFPHTRLCELILQFEREQTGFGNGDSDKDD